MARKPEKAKATEVSTTGHSWDGIEEYNNPLPRWWLWTFYATIIFGIGYIIAYPSIPLVHKAYPGLLGFSTRGQVAKEIAAFKEKNAAIESKLAKADLTKISEDPELYDYAVNAGRAVFKTNCIQCHGAGGAGAKGYPNLLDDDWLWGGDIETIAYTIRHGIRSRSDETRFSEMPAFGDDELLSKEEIDAVVQYVRSLSGLDHDAALAEEGKTVFEDNCASCHGEDGKGDRDQGAPNLTDAIWLFGDSVEDITYTVTHARNVEMPTWGDRLTDAQINAVATYVHQLGGGE